MRSLILTWSTRETTGVYWQRKKSFFSFRNKKKCSTCHEQEKNPFLSYCFLTGFRACTQIDDIRGILISLSLAVTVSTLAALRREQRQTRRESRRKRFSLTQILNPMAHSIGDVGQKLIKLRKPHDVIRQCYHFAKALRLRYISSTTSFLLSWLLLRTLLRKYHAPSRSVSVRLLTFGNALTTVATRLGNASLWHTGIFSLRRSFNLGNKYHAYSVFFSLLKQEIRAYNELLELLYSTCDDLRRALVGETVVSEVLEETQRTLLMNEVPMIWKVRTRLLSSNTR